MTNLNMPIMHWKQAYDRRVNMKINSISSFATPDESPIKNNNKKSSINQVIDKAADVFISEKGKELLMQDKGKDLEIGPATNELKSMEEKQAKIYESKGKIKEIEKRLEEDETLTDDDKNVLLEEKARLEKESETPEDKLHKLKTQKRELEKEMESGRLLPGEGGEQLAYYKVEISSLKREMQDDEVHREKLVAKSNQEKADAAVINAKKEQNKEDKIVMDNSELIQQENSITSDTISYLKTNYPQKEKNDNSIGRVKES